MAEKIEGYLLPLNDAGRATAMADLFADMDCIDQALFFNHLAERVARWPRDQGFQWRMMQGDLTPGGKAVITAMEDHTSDEI